MINRSIICSSRIGNARCPRQCPAAIPSAVYGRWDFSGWEQVSKCIRFSDINTVRFKRRQNRDVPRYSELLNSLDSGATTKITINNKRINKIDFERSILIPEHGGDRLDEYRSEYNRMLMSKVPGTSNSVVQERYITVSVHKKNIDEARTFFARVINDIHTHLAHVGSHGEELSAAERLRVFHDFYRVARKFISVSISRKPCEKGIASPITSARIASSLARTILSWAGSSGG